MSEMHRYVTIHYRDALLNRVSLVEICERFGIKLTPLVEGQWWEADCPYCGKASFNVHENTVRGHQTYFCSPFRKPDVLTSCHACGDIIGMTLRLRNCGYFDAIEWLAEIGDFQPVEYHEAAE